MLPLWKVKSMMTDTKLGTVITLYLRQDEMIGKVG